MQDLTLEKISNPLKGNIKISGSKSLSNRILIMSAIANISSDLHNISNSEDTILLQKLLQSNADIFDCGMAGTTLRFLTSYKALKNQACTITGDDRMKQRPIKPLVDALIDLGAEIKYLKEAGFPPFNINKGLDLNAKYVSIDASISSQFVSSICLIAPYMNNGLEIELQGKIVSDSYLEMTLSLMQLFGIQISREQNKILIQKGKYDIREIDIESDWSSVAYYYAYCGLLLGSEIKIFGEWNNSLQGDASIAMLMRLFGVETEYYDGYIVLKSKEVSSPPIIELDLMPTPDLFQTYAFFFAAKGNSVLYTGLDTLAYKETNRILAVKTELAKIGVSLAKLPKQMSQKSEKTYYLQEGKAVFEKLVLSTYNDHRMAMAGSLMATIGRVKIENPKVVEKSYPNFFTDLQKLTK